MTQFTCKECGEEHDLSDWEPSYRLPDEVFALSEQERAARASHGRSLCELKGVDGAASRWFVRTLLPFAVEGYDEPCSWGLWVEVDAAAAEEIYALWDDPSQLQAGPWQATLANDAATYPRTSGLRGSLRFTQLDRIPQLSLSPDQLHPFVAEQQAGVTEQRLLEWFHAFQGEDEEAGVDETSSRTLECGTHGTAHGALVCTHLVDARDRSVGFVEICDDPEDLQAWCDECEQLFLREGERTDAFEEFCHVRLVCVFCYATIKERHSSLSRAETSALS